MSHYRAPPAVLPSPDLDVIGSLAWESDVRARMAEIRAAAAPCPAFIVGPSDHRWRFPPPPTPMPGPGRSISE